MTQTPNYPVLIASGVALLAGVLVASAAVTGALPELAARQKAAAAEAKTCPNCGVVAAIRKRGIYDVTVHMDDGRVVTLSQDEAPTVAPGDRVRVNGDVLVRG